MIKIMLSAVLLYASLLGASATYAAPSQDSDVCLDWEVETYASGDALSSCAYFNPDKVSTRFTVINHCSTPVRGVFSYLRDTEPRVMSVQPFKVRPGGTAVVANPCDGAADWSYQVTQVN
ncbi:hypothetical protein NCG89_16070 [Spongiibacter taiwanensis]|uniref:hypothetical protein n=1 Tax=Spongiibacter taiwanensis TaxID=1748242 RepID=UPI002034D7B2|nr:hypothetical protein [Spongiibacter taiwanensis]USA43042.1 hypothetical protein NCG89_16070 [Spongiibacter taiwanensis]